MNHQSETLLLPGKSAAARRRLAISQAREALTGVVDSFISFP